MEDPPPYSLSDDLFEKSIRFMLKNNPNTWNISLETLTSLKPGIIYDSAWAAYSLTKGVSEDAVVWDPEFNTSIANVAFFSRNKSVHSYILDKLMDKEWLKEWIQNILKYWCDDSGRKSIIKYCTNNNIDIDHVIVHDPIFVVQVYPSRVNEITELAVTHCDLEQIIILTNYLISSNIIFSLSDLMKDKLAERMIHYYTTRATIMQELIYYAVPAVKSDVEWKVIKDLSSNTYNNIASKVASREIIYVNKQSEFFAQLSLNEIIPVSPINDRSCNLLYTARFYTSISSIIYDPENAIICSIEDCFSLQDVTYEQIYARLFILSSSHPKHPKRHTQKVYEKLRYYLCYTIIHSILSTALIMLKEPHAKQNFDENKLLSMSSILTNYKKYVQRLKAKW